MDYTDYKSKFAVCVAAYVLLSGQVLKSANETKKKPKTKRYWVNAHYKSWNK